MKLKANQAFPYLLIAVIAMAVIYHHYFGNSSSKYVPSEAWWGAKDFGMGSVVLVRKGKTYGAFQLLDLGKERKSELHYRWIFRQDDGAELDPLSDRVLKGESRTAGNRIEFGPFKIAWSPSSFSRVYLYYDHLPFEPVRSGDLELSVTNLQDFNGINAADAKWVYKGALRDSGR